MTRGIGWTLSARSKRGIGFFWVALFVFSLFLQYASFASAPPVSAVHNDGFELDGNTVDGAAAGTDWDAIYQDAATFFANDVVGSATDDIFKGGGSKDNNDIDEWLWTQQNVQDKDDIVTAYAFPRDSGGDLIAWFGQDRLQTNGDAVVGFWFFKDDVTKTDIASNGGFEFDGLHQVGDILVLADFSNGGSNGEVFVYRWVGSGGDTEGVLDCLLRPAPATATCAASGDNALAVINNTAVVDAAWRQDIPINAFFEGGINLTALGLDADCFSSFMAQSRSSTSFDSTLSDFVLGQFSLCVKPNLLTSVDDQTITIGGSVTDTATLSGSKGPVTGTVSFFVCGPDANANPDCSDTDAGTQVGGAVTIVAGSATSALFEPPAPGTTASAPSTRRRSGSKYLATEHTNLENECFNVAMAQPLIATTASASVPVGGQISDTATVSGGFNPTAR